MQAQSKRTIFSKLQKERDIGPEKTQVREDAIPGRGSHNRESPILSAGSARLTSLISLLLSLADIIPRGTI